MRPAASGAVALRPGGSRSFAGPPSARRHSRGTGSPRRSPVPRAAGRSGAGRPRALSGVEGRGWVRGRRPRVPGGGERIERGDRPAVTLHAHAEALERLGVAAAPEGPARYVERRGSLSRHGRGVHRARRPPRPGRPDRGAERELSARAHARARDGRRASGGSRPGRRDARRTRGRRAPGPARAGVPDPRRARSRLAGALGRRLARVVAEQPLRVERERQADERELQRVADPSRRRRAVGLAEIPRGVARSSGAGPRSGVRRGAAPPRTVRQTTQAPCASKEQPESASRRRPTGGRRRGCRPAAPRATRRGGATTPAGNGAAPALRPAVRAARRRRCRAPPGARAGSGGALREHRRQARSAVRSVDASTSRSKPSFRTRRS